MLYDRWRQIARERRSEWALSDPSTGAQWTFGQLDAATEAQATYAASVAFPQGHTPEFILSVIRSWRAGQLVCPLETNQKPPPLDSLPPACVHLKLTSATTGSPRMVALTAQQLAADADNIVATMGMRPDWPNLAVISLAHSYGFSNLVTPLLLDGIPLIIGA